MKVDIQHIIDQTSKEIYSFAKIGDYWHYTGISYSNRNDSSDTWGDQWYKKFEKQQESEYNEVAQRHGYDSYYELWDHEDVLADCDIQRVSDKYNPVCNKTKDGRTYLCGTSWGVGGKCGKYRPKISEDEIISEIAKQITNIKIKL